MERKIGRKTPLSNMWATKSELEEERVSLFLPPPPARLSFFNVGEGSVGNGLGNGVHSEIDKELQAT